MKDVREYEMRVDTLGSWFLKDDNQLGLKPGSATTF